MLQPTIAAIATPPGQGGIGVVRISGPEAFVVADRIFRPYGSRRIADLKGYTSSLGRVTGEDGDLDEAIVSVYREPKSYTGEDVIEISCHGGPVLMHSVLRRCLDSGAVPAGPGEFTRRAFLAGKLDLSQAEAVMDLISAGSEDAAKAAMSARDGVLSRRIQELVQNLTARCAHLAAWADYPEEDIPEVECGQMGRSIMEFIEDLDGLLSSYEQGRLVREGAYTVIAGRPNAGKSTLMNQLSGVQSSIVTEIPGTTRDVVEYTVQVGESILHLADTAGLRIAEDLVEQIGVDAAWNRLERADLVLAVFDSADSLGEDDFRLLDYLEGRRCIAVVNKTDREEMRLDFSEIKRRISRVVNISAKTGEGTELLRNEIQKVLGTTNFDPYAPLLANERQKRGVMRARESLIQAMDALESGVTMDAVNVLLEDALDALLVLTGQRATVQVLDEVFFRFCVGK